MDPCLDAVARAGRTGCEHDGVCGDGEHDAAADIGYAEPTATAATAGRTEWPAAHGAAP